MTLIQIEKKCITFMAFIAVGILIGIYWGEKTYTDNFHKQSFEIRENGNYTYINPLLQCNIGEQYISKNAINPFKSKISEIIESQKLLKNISFASVYFRDLNNGSWFGINEDEKFRPASLLKVLVMIYFLKCEHDNPGILDRKVVYEGENLGLIQSIKPLNQVEIGKEYSVWELITYMIKYSDNLSTAKLSNMMDGDKFVHLFDLFDIRRPESVSAQDFISVKEYSSFFRILFNASYVDAALSEKALSLLNEVEFSEGLRKSIKPDIKISHKFGEFEFEDGSKQLHDCGIVYYPKRPYLICIMTRGSDLTKMSTSIQTISKSVYEEVDRQVSSKK
jgi:beta-lactamase class A